MLKLACSIGNKVCIHGDDTVITGILCFQNLNDLIFDQLRILDFIRNDQVKNQIDLIFSVNHTKIVERKFRIDGMYCFCNLRTDRKDTFVMCLDRIHMDHQENI